MKKKVIYEPFDRSGGQLNGLGLLFDPDISCPENLSRKDVEDANLLDLELIAKDISESIADYETIIDIQMDECRRNSLSSESLTNDRRRKQQLEVELREIKKRIKVMKNELKEATVA